MRWVLASLVAVAPLVFAPASVSASSCPEGFHPHPVSDGYHDHGEHRHVGMSMDKVDRNGDGQICVKHVTPAGDIHVHIDDFTP